MMKNSDKNFGAGALSYAKALVELGITEENLDEIQAVFLNTPEFMAVLKNPGISFEQKEMIIDKVFTDKISKNFLKVILSHGDLYLLLEISNACKYLFMLQNRTLVAIIRCVTPPSDKQLGQIKEIIMDKHNCKDVSWQIVEDKKLISGFILQVEGVEYDYSLRSRINRLKTNLTGR